MRSWAIGRRRPRGLAWSTTRRGSSGPAARACSGTSCVATLDGSATGWAAMPDIHPRGEHSWFRARLDPQALGLLDEEEEKRFLEHARACEGCAAAMKAHRENPPLGGPDVHIPPHVIARWDRASRRVEGLPRKMFREHLEHCASCRQDLEVLGFTPSLPLDQALEAGEADPLKPTTTTTEVALKQPDRQVLIVKRYGLCARDRWRGWALGGIA